jgi:hypothetical protein
MGRSAGGRSFGYNSNFGSRNRSRSNTFSSKPSYSSTSSTSSTSSSGSSRSSNTSSSTNSSSSINNTSKNTSTPTTTHNTTTHPVQHNHHTMSNGVSYSQIALFSAFGYIMGRNSHHGQSNQPIIISDHRQQLSEHEVCAKMEKYSMKYMDCINLNENNQNQCSKEKDDLLACLSNNKVDY